MAWHIALDPTGEPSRKSFPSPWHPSLCFRMKLSFVVTQTQLWFQTRISGATYLRLLCQSQAWLTFLHFFTLFGVNVTCARDLRSNHRLLRCFLPETSTSNPKPKIPSTHHSWGSHRKSMGMLKAWLQPNTHCKKKERKKKAHRKYGALRVALFLGHKKLEPLRIGKPHQLGWVLDDQKKQKELLLLSGENESPPSLTEAQTSLANVFHIWVEVTQIQLRYDVAWAD